MWCKYLYNYKPTYIGTSYVPINHEILNCCSWFCHLSCPSLQPSKPKSVLSQANLSGGSTIPLSFHRKFAKHTADGMQTHQPDQHSKHQTKYDSLNRLRIGHSAAECCRSSQTLSITARYQTSSAVRDLPTRAASYLMELTPAYPSP